MLNTRKRLDFTPRLRILTFRPHELPISGEHQKKPFFYGKRFANGKKWNILESIGKSNGACDAIMNQFYGEEKCLIDANGRLKLCPRFISLFDSAAEQVVLHCLPEGALGVYPPQIWQQMRQFEPRPAARAANSLLHRRQMRRFGALTQFERLSNQGRLTIPSQFRDRLNLSPGDEVYTVGCEIGVEIWNADAWLRESEEVVSHELERGYAEMRADLNAPLPDR